MRFLKMYLFQKIYNYNKLFCTTSKSITYKQKILIIIIKDLDGHLQDRKLSGLTNVNCITKILTSIINFTYKTVLSKDLT